MTLVIEKGLILGLFLAVLFGLFVGRTVGGFLAFMFMDAGPQWIAPVVGLSSAVGAGWLGWELGHWFIAA